jgi:DNA-binding transcriptional LysR family regulator
MADPFPIPLSAIRAIETVARRGSLAGAAEEMGVTIGAVSQHVRRAEERLELTLFERTPRGLVPSGELRAVLPQLTGGFATLRDAMATLVGRDEGVLTVTCGSVFASRWLIWRLRDFSERFPAIEPRLAVTGTMLDLMRPDLDCGIRFGRGNWPGVKSELIGGSRYSPVCAPSLAGKIQAVEDLANVPVIRDLASMLPWDDWFDTVKVAPLPLHGPTFSDPALAFDAAISGQGVLMAIDMMSDDAVRDGRLVRPFAQSHPSDLGYWLVVAEGRRSPKKVRLFREWILGAAAGDRDATA